mmetsp:Transcript_7253/g.14113  ORF Transcript_7253/g.14113 Transcript_7253/m.14113 type:complete len:113 (-) Transcript_7253:113-451(-)
MKCYHAPSVSDSFKMSSVSWRYFRLSLACYLMEYTSEWSPSSYPHLQRSTQPAAKPEKLCTERRHKRDVCIYVLARSYVCDDARTHNVFIDSHQRKGGNATARGNTHVLRSK